MTAFFNKKYLTHLSLVLTFLVTPLLLSERAWSYTSEMTRVLFYESIVLKSHKNEEIKFSYAAWGPMKINNPDYYWRMVPPKNMPKAAIADGQSREKDRIDDIRLVFNGIQLASLALDDDYPGDYSEEGVEELLRVLEDLVKPKDRWIAPVLKFMINEIHLKETNLNIASRIIVKVSK